MQSRSSWVSAHRLADEEAVVENAVVGERGALRRARGAGRELNVDRIVELQPAGEFAEPGAVLASPISYTCAKGIVPVAVGTADLDDRL